MRSILFGSTLLALMVMNALPVAAYIDSPALAKKVSDGSLPPVDERLPETPRVLALDLPGQEVGQYGGLLKMLMGRPKDIRMMVVYGYARLVGYDANWNLVPDILEKVDIEEGRSFTLHLRKGHRWSDGHPFTSEDFRYYWEDVLNDEDLSHGIPRFLLVDKQPPQFEVIDEATVRFAWDKPNPFFLPALAGARPEFIYMPAHYMKQFHSKHADGNTIKKLVETEGQRDWIALHYRMGHQYQNDNPALPTLQPWVNTTEPPSTRFLFVRNPYFHRVDAKGQQLPYIDEVAISIVNSKLVPAKAAAGEADLQARNINFENYAVLKQGEERNDFKVFLWSSGRGSQLALLPNLNAVDPEWRAVLRNPKFRHALSTAINRDEVSQVIYFGLAQPGNNTVLEDSPLFQPEFATLWAEYDIDKANKLLDEVGLINRNSEGIRQLPDGRTMDLIVETAGEDSTQVDVLQLVADSWKKIGVRMLIKPQQREVLRNRVFSGATLMSVWTGLENALPTSETSPQELAPTSQHQLQWPKWGQYFETGGQAGEPVDMDPAKELLRLSTEWENTFDPEARKKIWQKMLGIHAEQTFTIGTVRGVPQPIVVTNRLHNVPEKGIYNWEPGAYFGIYHPDTFWLDADN